jgi:hypothetical protein
LPAYIQRFGGDAIGQADFGVAVLRHVADFAIDDFHIENRHAQQDEQQHDDQVKPPSSFCLTDSWLNMIFPTTVLICRASGSELIKNQSLTNNPVYCLSFDRPVHESVQGNIFPLVQAEECTGL